MLKAVIDLNILKLDFSFLGDKVNLHISPEACNWDLEIDKTKGGSLPRFYTDWLPRKSEVVLLLLKILSQLGWTEERASLLKSGWLEIVKTKDRRNERAYVWDSNGRHLLTLYRNDSGCLAVSFHDDLGFFHSGIKTRLSEEIVRKLIHAATERAVNFLGWQDYIAILAAIGELPKEGEEDSCAVNWQFYPLENEQEPGKTFWFSPDSARQYLNGPGKRV